MKKEAVAISLVSGIFISTQIFLLLAKDRSLDVILISFGIYIAVVLTIKAFASDAMQPAARHLVNEQTPQLSRFETRQMQTQSPMDNPAMQMQPEPERPPIEMPRFAVKDFGFVGLSSATHAEKPLQPQAAAAFTKTAATDSDKPSIPMSMKLMLQMMPDSQKEQFVQMAEKMDDAMLMQTAAGFGVKMTSATQLRDAIVTFAPKLVQPPPAAAASESTQSNDVPRTSRKSQLDKDDFNAYVRKCMSGNEESEDTSTLKFVLHKGAFDKMQAASPKSDNHQPHAG
jgi:hypothetical protein